MVPAKISTLELSWATRPGGGGRTERHYRDFVVDGVALSTVLTADVVSAFGWAAADEQVAIVDRLLRRASPDLPEGRGSLYGCPECWDLGCGVVSLVIEGVQGGIVWRDFGFQNNYENAIYRMGYEDLGPFLFDGRDYHLLLAGLGRDIRESGV